MRYDTKLYKKYKDRLKSFKHFNTIYLNKYIYNFNINILFKFNYLLIKM